MFCGHHIFLNPDLRLNQCSVVVIWNSDLAVNDVHWIFSATTRFLRTPDLPLQLNARLLLVACLAHVEVLEAVEVLRLCAHTRHVVRVVTCKTGSIRLGIFFSPLQAPTKGFGLRPRDFFALWATKRAFLCIFLWYFSCSVETRVTLEKHQKIL